MSNTLAIAVANHIIQLAIKDNELVSPMKLLKLTYIAHGWSLGLKNSPLFIDEIQAWRYGPVIPTIYETYKEFRNLGITAPLVPAGFSVVPALNEDESALVNAVWNGYKHLSALALSALTHEKGTPWFKVYEEGGGKNSFGAKINDSLIKEHYKELIKSRMTRHEE